MAVVYVVSFDIFRKSFGKQNFVDLDLKSLDVSFIYVCIMEVQSFLCNIYMYIYIYIYVYIHIYIFFLFEFLINSFDRIKMQMEVFQKNLYKL